MSRTAIRVLGVDPGTRVAGWGVLDVAPGRPPCFVACGPVRLPAGPIPARLRILHDELAAVIAEHRPQVLAIETVFHGKSFASVLKVGEARGAVLVLASLSGLEIHEFAPAMVKKSATGNGRATKLQVQAMIRRILGVEIGENPVDVSDALAIAFCYGQRLWRQRSKARSSSLDRLAQSTRGEQRRCWNEKLASAMAREQEARASGGDVDGGARRAQRIER